MFGAFAAAGDAGGWRPVFSGLLPAGVDGGFGARIDSVGHECLMAATDGQLAAYEFRHGRFVKRGSIALPVPLQAPDGGSPISVSASFCAGDADGDGVDEVLVVGGRAVRKYKWLRDAFAPVATGGVRFGNAAQRWWISDIAVGDVNNDDTNEVLLTGVERPPGFDEDWSPPLVVLFVCRWRGDSLVQLWNDGGSLKLEGPNWIVPCGGIVGVMDIRNLGHNELIVAEGQSDVSATSFHELWWTDGALENSGTFVLRDSQLQRNSGDTDPCGAAVGAFDFCRTANGTVLLGVAPGDDWSWRGELYMFVGDSLASRRAVWEDTDSDDQWSPSRGKFIDLDGSGPGIMRIRHRRDGSTRYAYYRL